VTLSENNGEPYPEEYNGDDQVKKYPVEKAKDKHKRKLVTSSQFRTSIKELYKRARQIFDRFQIFGKRFSVPKDGSE